MQRYSRLWWASILLSSVVTGGSSFAVLALLAGLPVEIAIAGSVTMIVVGDIVLAFIMERLSPTRVFLGPGDRRNRDDLPMEIGKAIADFENGSGNVSIRGEQWRARQVADCDQRLEAGSLVRVLDRQGLTLVVAAAHPS